MFEIFDIFKRKNTKYSYFGVSKSKFQEKQELGEDQLGDVDTGFRHSTFYHNYYQGYSEILVDKPNGRQRIERIYTAPYRRQDVSDKKCLQTKIAYAAAIIVGIAAYLWGLLLDLPSNCANIVAFPGMLTAIPMFLSFVQTCSYAAAPREMTLGQYKSSVVRLRRAALAASIGLLLTMLAKIVYISFMAEEFSPAELYSLAAIAAAAAALCFIYFSEHNMKYEFVANNTVVNEERYEIW